MQAAEQIGSVALHFRGNSGAHRGLHVVVRFRVHARVLPADRGSVVKASEEHPAEAGVIAGHNRYDSA